MGVCKASEVMYDEQSRSIVFGLEAEVLIDVLSDRSGM